MRAPRGLTLIELLVTVAMMSIAAALVIPSMNSSGVLRVQAAARTIVSDITLAQTEAMAFQVRRGILFGAVLNDEGAYEAGNGYVVTEPTTQPISLANVGTYALTFPDSPTDPYAVDFDRESQRFGGAVISNPGFDGESVLMFDELGAPLRLVTPSGGGSPEALASNGGGLDIVAPGIDVTYRVTVDALTGRVDVIRVEDDDEDDAED
jgi:prepilin-type N-terminal cleavage/methylation domain-containing protein